MLFPTVVNFNDSNTDGSFTVADANYIRLSLLYLDYLE